MPGATGRGCASRPGWGGARCGRGPAPAGTGTWLGARGRAGAEGRKGGRRWTEGRRGGRRWMEGRGPSVLGEAGPARAAPPARQRPRRASGGAAGTAAGAGGTAAGASGAAGELPLEHPGLRGELPLERREAPLPAGAFGAAAGVTAPVDPGAPRGAAWRAPR